MHITFALFFNTDVTHPIKLIMAKHDAMPFSCIAIKMLLMTELYSHPINLTLWTAQTEIITPHIAHHVKLFLC